MAWKRMDALRRRCALTARCAVLLLFFGLSAWHPAFSSEKTEPGASGKYILLKEKPFDSSGGTGLLPDQMVRLLQYYLLNTGSCTGASGSWAVNTPPVNGAVSTGIYTKMASGGYCPGDYFPYAAIYYTWTGSTNGQYTDSFTATWSQGSYSSTVTFSISVVDGQIAAIGKTLGNCGCNPGDKPAGDPVNVGSGNLSEQVTDYTTTGQNPLALSRYYNSFNETTTQIILLNGVQPFISSSALGGHWRTNYDRFLVPQSGSVMAVERQDGRTLTFTQTGGVWATDSDVGITLTQSGGTYRLTDTDDTVETYVPDSSGGVTLASIVSRGGYTQNLSYNAGGELETVTDTYGRTLKFSYTSGYLTGVTTPDNTTITYSYGISGVDGTTPDRLAGVTYPTSPATSQTYSYGTGQYSYQLTGITDEDGHLFASWTYDGSNRVLTSQHANGADLTTIAYDDANGSRTVTNALGEQETEQFSASQNVLKISEIDRAATSTIAAASRLFTYDGNGYLASSTDWNGNLTTFTNNARGLPTHIVEASGTSVARTTNITWDKIFHEPDVVATQGITQSFTYNGSGSPTSRTDTASNLKRSWTYVWSNALLASVTGPRTDVTQTTSFTYGTHGQLAGIINALGQTTRIPSSTVGGRPLAAIDPNNIKTTFTYDARQRLLTQTVVTKASNFTTSWSYDPAGNLTNMQLPDGSYLANAYDAAHRLIMTGNAIGDTIAYMLDALGDRTQDVVGRGSTATWQHGDAFDALGRVITDQGGAGQTTAISRDPNGNPLMITDPLSRVTAQTFDALNRVTKITDPSKGNTSFAYDAHDRVTKVIAPNGAVTTYAYDGFGRVLTRVSPDTGTTSYAYDLADNQTQSQDAAGVVTNHAYDALNRLTGTAYPGDASENVALTYDQSGHGFGIGRLTSLTDAVGSLSLSYDERGNELRETRKSGSVTRATSYSYDAASRIAGIGYPSGTVVAYGRNAAGEVTALTAQLPKLTQATSIVSGATYEPFGPIAGFTYGNGLAESRSYDAAYRLGTLTAGSVQALTYSYNAADDVTGIKDGVTYGNSQSLAYDVLDRLTGATGAYGTFKWSYDHAGNRLTQALGGSATDYSYLSKSNVLSSIASNGATTQVTTSAAGNTLALTPASGNATDFAFNQAERLASVTVGSTQKGSYAYDAFGERFSKQAGTLASLFLHDQSGRLLEETNANGAVKTDTIYFNGAPVADVSAGNIFYLHTDNIGTPQLATTSTQAVAWQAAYQPFGINTGAQGLLTQNLRFPGQYADAETGLYQNGFRDYNPVWGGYMESDPIGLNGGVNTFGYVGENPLKFEDSYGLLRTDSNGNIVTTPASWLDRILHSSPGFTPVYVYGDNGQQILAFQPDNSSNFNCHGNTFSQGQLAIDNNQIPSILASDGYTQVSKQDAQDNNIVLFLDQNSIAIHSVTIISVDPNDIGNSLVEGKNGPNGPLVVGPLSQVPYQGRQVFFRKNAQ